ncbi:Tetratricopeptide repeat-containing protein [Flexibacter flexilis DSM 6793]|uniref:Tetratricopeptide repeat-containing protein n=1 Tax=Flexibacter flexilis DSM 6793 TaxID=927664 RepID=A0A1I1MLP1_9BACT|nr:tetratricopeptide repeat protein [Flexibacter flexilis]SFC84088.1 Tetratricopeptide repeat-containing protein [Flexibacter flexilis DSM 6793]
MKTKLIFIFVFIKILVNAQNPSDTLLSKIKNYTKQDSVRVELLVDACVAGIFTADTQHISYANEAFSISKKINYELGKIRAINCIGNYYFQRADFDKAINYYTQALKLAESRKDGSNIIISKSNIANVFAHTKRERKSISLYKECDAILLERGDSLTQNRAAILTNMATAYSSIQQHDSAITAYNKVLIICHKINSVFGLGITKSNLASEYYLTKNYDTALKYAQKSLEITNQYHLDFLKTTLYKTFGSTYVAMGNAKKGVQYLNLCVELSKNINAKENLLEVYGKLHNAYAAGNDFRNAYLNAVNYIVLKDTIFGIEKEKTINEINTKYETEKKEIAIKELQQKNVIFGLQSQRKTIVIYGILGGIIAVLLVAYFMFMRYKSKKQNELLTIQLLEAKKTFEAEKKATDSELKALKSQMNPHFLFNALNSVQEQFMYGDKMKGNELLSDFTYLTRQILSVSGKKQIPLNTEIEILTKYLELENMRFAKDFEYSITCDEIIDEDYISIPPMMIQPFVENSIKHGLLHKQGEKKIDIYFSLDEAQETLLCKVQDNGIGRKKSAEIKSKNEHKHVSFSTDSIQQRLELLNQNLKLKNLV